MKTNEAGFTFIELLAAVVLLVIFLTVIIGTQTNFTDAFLNEESRSRAAMYAQYIMTFAEIEAEAPEPGSSSSTLAAKLSELGYFQLEEGSALEEKLRDWDYKEEITSVAIPPNDDALRRIDLTVSWGDSTMEELTLVYFMKGPRLAPGGAAGFGGTNVGNSGSSLGRP